MGPQERLIGSLIFFIYRGGREVGRRRKALFLSFLLALASPELPKAYPERPKASPDDPKSRQVEPKRPQVEPKRS